MRDWEGDLIIGAALRTALATLVERKTRYTVLVSLPDGHAAPIVADALFGAFTLLPARLRRTLTWDQGNQMFPARPNRAATGLWIYFADPHSPHWQRGSNENTYWCRVVWPVPVRWEWRPPGDSENTCRQLAVEMSTAARSLAWSDLIEGC